MTKQDVHPAAGSFGAKRAGAGDRIQRRRRPASAAAVLLVLALALLFALSLAGCGEKGADGAWPSKDITIYVGYAAGGTADTASRQLAQQMGEILGVQIQVLNVPGGSGSMAGLQADAAQHDGYTWLGDVAHTVSGWRSLGYADLGWQDFYGFYGAVSPYVLFVTGTSPYRSCQDLFAAMAVNPGMKWGNAGLGSLNHLTGQMLLDTLGLEGVAVPYDGGRTAAIKVLAEEVTWSWCGISDIADLAESGEIRILAICAPEPLSIETPEGIAEIPSLLQDCPSLAHLQDLLYWGFRVPRDTPAEVVSALRDAFQEVVSSADWAEFCREKSILPVCLVNGDSDEMCARLESLYAWGLYDLSMTVPGLSPEDLGIPRLQDFTFPPSGDDAAAAGITPWPD